MKNFKKSDLKRHMVIEQEDGTRLLVNDDNADTASNAYGLVYLSRYNDDLTRPGKGFNIDKVFTLKKDPDEWLLVDVFADSNLKLVWKREKIRNLTAMEMKRELEQLTGDKIQISDQVGRWIPVKSQFETKYKCPTCNRLKGVMTRFCPSCGADMGVD